MLSEQALPEALIKLVLSLLSLDPALRPASAAEVIDRLSAIAELPKENELALGRGYLASTPLVGRVRERVSLANMARETANGHGATAASLRTRMMYYVLRGETAQAHNYRRLLELSAVETGGLWQVQCFAIPIEALAAAAWHDLMSLRRALERYDQLLAETPALLGGRDAMLLPYHFHRGDFEAAAAAGDEYVRKRSPMSKIGWAGVYAMTALAYAHIGQPARALEICQQAMDYVTEEEREYFVVYSPLEAAYATALALTGNKAKSREVFRARIERLQASGEHARLVVMHHYRARLARFTGEQEAVQSAVADMLDIAAASGNPAVYALAQRLSEERSAQSELPPFALDDRQTG